MKNKKILIAEDEISNSQLLKKILMREGCEIVSVNNGADALDCLAREHFDALLTDWMMPKMDGIELIRKVRESIQPPPLIIMITALVSVNARNYALESGADDFVAKPTNIDELISRLKEGLDRKEQESSCSPSISGEQSDLNVIPPFVAVAFATSTGGPPAIIEIFRHIPANLNVAFYIVQHGPGWMLETFCQRLSKETDMNVYLPEDNCKSCPGSIYVAPGEKHLVVHPRTYTVELNEGPRENFLRPAADPLFKSIASGFGRFGIGVVLTGLGKDGVKGSSLIASAGGSVFVQDPNTAIAPSMPKSVIDSGIPNTKLPLTDLGNAISCKIRKLSEDLSADRLTHH
jgi:two-component system chemotaxis response regulator CheB